MTTFLRLKNTLRFLFLCMAFWGIHTESFGQTVLGLQDFETTPGTPTMTFTNTGGGFSTGKNSSSGFPANANLFVSGARGFQSNNATAILTFANVSLSGYASNFVDFKLAGMSTANTTNGIDVADRTTLAISVDGGTTFSNEVIIEASAANQKWDFTAGSTTQTYDGDNNPVTVITSSASGIANVRLNLPNSVGQVVIKITMITNDTAERLVIDDVRVVGGVLANAAPTATAVNFTGTLKAGQTLTSSYTYGDAESNPSGTPTYRWFRANDIAGTGQAVIAGATSSTYTLTNDDTGKFIRVGVTPTATAGTSPGTEGVSAYQGPVEASGNTSSTITVTPGFVPATNVDYKLYTGTDVTGTSFEIARFNVNDIVGVPTNDGFPTILNNLTFSLSNSAYIEKVAIYNNANVEIQELAAAATLNFTGLNISAASGSSATFSVRVTFKTTVTDNAQPQLTITSATASGETSFFAAANAGGASSSVSGDDNRIEVTASRLVYLQNATDTYLGVNMSPAVTVRATDINHNLDADFTGNVTLTSVAPLTSAQNQAAVAGIATFSTISFSSVGTGFTLGANSAGLQGATSNPFNVTVQAAGELLMEENFDYTVASNLTSHGWGAHSGGGTSPIKVHTTGLNYTGYGSTNTGLAATFNANGEDVNKVFAARPSGSVTYAAFLVNVIEATAAGDYVVMLAPEVTGTEFRARFYTRFTGGNLQFGVSSTGATQVYATGNYAYNTTYLIVLKHTYNSGAALQTTEMFINPSLYTEPQVANASQSTSVLSNGIGSIALRQSSTSNKVIVDGIRVGTNWGAVLGNPVYDADATINSGNYNSITVLAGTATTNGLLTVNNAITVDSNADFILPTGTNLIQKGSVNNNSGAITTSREVSMKRLEYVYWSAPVAGQDLKLFTPYTVSPTNAPGFPTPTGSSRFYTLNETTNAFQAIVEPLGTSFQAGHGYMLRAPNNFPANNTTPAIFTGTFTGVPNNGDISVNVTNTGLGMNMIGNPYPSTIDASDFLDANTTLETLYFWSHEGANYATYNATGQASPGTGAITPNGTIAAGQGFIAKTNAAATVHFTNALRVNNTQGQFFRGVANEQNRIWLNFSKESTPLNQILTGYVTNATNDLDPKFDGKLFDATGSKLYNLVDNSEYVIQGRALPFSATDVVALGFKAATAGNYTIAIDHVDGLFTQGQDIFIKDNLTGVTHDLNQGDYTFASEAGTFNQRFTMVYQTTLGITNPSVDGNSVVVFTNDNVLNINSGNVDMQNVKIFDIRGRLLFEQKDINATTVSISNLKAAKQVLVVQVTADNKTISKKVVY